MNNNKFLLAAAVLLLSLAPRVFADVTVFKSEIGRDWIYVNLTKEKKGSGEQILGDVTLGGLKMGISHAEYESFAGFLASPHGNFDTYPRVNDTGQIGYLEGACSDWKFQGVSDADVSQYLSIAKAIGQLRHDNYLASGDFERLLPGRCYVLGATERMTLSPIYLFEVAAIASDDRSITLRQIRVVKP